MLSLLKINFEEDTKTYNAIQELRIELGLCPFNCVYPSHCSCREWNFGVFTCDTCGKHQPICYGADDNQYEVCDACYKWEED